jgi:hypothetical protein
MDRNGAWASLHLHPIGRIGEDDGRPKINVCPNPSKILHEGIDERGLGRMEWVDIESRGKVG